MPALMADEKYELNLSAGDLPNNFTRDFSRNFSNTSLENFFRQYQTGNHFHRVDSEDQFRKFLEKIPSTTNLAAIAQTNGQGQQANGDAISQGQMFPMSYGMPTSSPLSAQLPEQGALHVGGIPRVASLDLLRQLMGTPGAAPQMKSSLAVKEEPRDQSNGSESMHIPSEQNPAFNLPPLGMRMSSQATLPRSGSEDHIPSGEPSTSYLTNGAVEDMAVTGNGRLKANKESGTQSKAEQRRARRMLSNRESARRSRRRKQEHLGALEDQIANLETEKEHLAGRNEKLQRQLNVANDQNSALKRELEELRQQLGIEAPEGSHKRSRGA